MIKVITYNGIKKDTKNMTLGHGKKIKLVKLQRTPPTQINELDPCNPIKIYELIIQGFQRQQ